MFKKFIDSYWFNIVLALLAAVLIIMQEVWIGTELVFLPLFALGVAASFGFSWSAEVIGFIFWHFNIKWKNIWVGTAVGAVAALVTALLVV